MPLGSFAQRAKQITTRYAGEKQKLYKKFSAILSGLAYEILDSCLTEGEIHCIEKNNGVKIPKQYCDFLLYIGNGIKLYNGNIIRGTRRPVYKFKPKRISYRFLFLEGMNSYFEIEEKPYPRYDGAFPQYEDCFDPINLENGCEKCKYYVECIDSCYEDNPLYDLQDNAYFNGCFDLYDTRLLIFTGDARGRVWRCPEADSSVLYPEFENFFEYIKFKAKG